MTRWIWVHLVGATLLAVAWLALGTEGVAYEKSPVFLDDKNTGICQRKYIRNDPVHLESLRGCEVIEGSLQLALVNSETHENWTNYSYPELREITGYLLVFEIYKLTSLQKLFPNLAVIRGQELIDTHALIISSGNQLQEIGLPSLTDIQRGTVWIVDNTQLCYVDTIDWSLITNESISEGIRGNKPSNQCPNACNNKCPISGIDGRHLCWSSGSSSCQKVFNQFCPLCHGRPCTDRGECCSHQCLGGCRGTSPRDCYVCKNVVFNGTCTEECPPGFYEYLKRRCVTREECLKIVAAPDVSKGSTTTLQGKVFEAKGRKQCILECPKDTELAPNKKECVRCKDSCKKNCPGMLVDSVDKARELAGCTKITGVLKISIRRSTSVIVKELKQSLDKIEEIDDHLVITHTYALLSLDFLENLKVIHGKNLEDGRYALVVRSNENLMELWDSKPNRTIEIKNENARVLFHYNPKLCPRKIWEFVAQSGIKQSKDDKDKIDIGITNGDKVTCNTQILNVEIEKKTNNSVLIRYENFRRNLTLPSHLLSYEIHFKEAVNYPAKNASKYDNRDPCGDDDWTVLDYSKISDADVRSQAEPAWEQSRLIANLKHYTWYAIYVKTIVIPGESNSLNNNTGAESDIIYFRTLPGVPSKPQEFKVTAGGPNVATLAWSLPLHPNGELEKFNIWLDEVKEDQKQQDQRDYCVQGRVTTKIPSGTSGKPAPTLAPFLPVPTKVGESVTISTKPKDPDCCSCSASGGKTTPPSYEDIHYKDDMINQIFNIVFIAKPDDGSEDPSNNEIETNSLRPRRSIRRPLEESSDNSGEKNDMIKFPGEKSSPGLDQPRVPLEMEKVKEIKVKPGERKYQYVLRNLTHFTTYKVGIQACRFIESTNSTEGENDTRTCSDLVVETVQTTSSPKADVIDKASISTNVTEGNRLHLTWNEPTNRNGVILAYVVKVQKMDGSKDYPSRHCITRKKFQATRNYSLPEGLAPGNYSVKIQVASLAKDSEWTEDAFVVIHDTEGGMTGFWTLIILLPVLLMITIGSLLAYYYIRTKEIGSRRIISANPEYMSNVEIPEEWEVPREKLIVKKDKELGQGSFGTVFEGILKDFIKGQSLMRCAVKTVSEDTSSEDRALFLREAALMVKLDCHCHHVVRLLGVISKTHPTYVIMELMTKGDLKNYLRSKRPGTYNNGEPPPTLRQILRMAAEIADGMAYIHQHKLVHRDLAARNCMVGEDLCVKVGDFGMTKEMLQTHYYRKQTKGLLPLRWMAPESLRDGVFTNQTDVWSFGVVLWEMATLAAQPYQGLSNSQVLEYVLSGRTMERPENCPDILFELMTWCWQIESRHRPNFVQILEKLSMDLDPSFAQVSFFHSPEGLLYQDHLKLQSKDEALIVMRFESLALPLATSEDEFEDTDDDEENGPRHYTVDELDTPSRSLLPGPSASTITHSRNQSSLINGLAINPLILHEPRNEFNYNNDSVNLSNHAIPAPTSFSTANPYNSGSRTSNSSNYSPRPRTNSNNNNTNPRLPISLNLQNSVACSNVNVRDASGGMSILGEATGSSSSLSSTLNFVSPIPNGVDSIPSNTFNQQHNHPAAGITTSSSKCSLNKSGDSKVDQSKTNAYNSSGSTDNSQALLINYSVEGNKISNGNRKGRLNPL